MHLKKTVLDHGATIIIKARKYYPPVSPAPATPNRDPMMATPAVVPRAAAPAPPITAPAPAATSGAARPPVKPAHKDITCTT